MTERDDILQRIMELVDGHITERLTPGWLAGESGYSASHLGRLFAEKTGLTIGSYLTRRKLQFALYDLAAGGRILDVALKYGFGTHAGFTRAFRKHFGYPPSVYRIHAITGRPTIMEPDSIRKIIKGAIKMDYEMIELDPVIVIGYTSRHRMPDVRFTHDVPVYWDAIDMEVGDPLTRLYDTFPGGKHGEYTVCYDIDEAAGEFSYLLGIAVADAEQRKKIEPDMIEMKLPGGLYAKFTTPWAKEADHIRTVRETWKQIFDSWLPGSEYAFDETRYDFEYYDERDHIYPGKDEAQIDIYIPVTKE